MDIEQMPYRPNVGIIVLNAEGKIWIGQRSDAKITGYQDSWQMPQGGIDKGEDVFAAAKRELLEETNISSVSLLYEIPDWIPYDLPPELIGIALKGKYRGQTQKWFVFRFEGDESEINIIEPAGGETPEFRNWKWATIAEVMEGVVPFKVGVYKRVFDSLKGKVSIAD